MVLQGNLVAPKASLVVLHAQGSLAVPLGNLVAPQRNLVAPQGNLVDPQGSKVQLSTAHDIETSDACLRA